MLIEGIGSLTKKKTQTLEFFIDYSPALIHTCNVMHLQQSHTC